MTNGIIIGVVLLVIAAAVAYVVKEKKRGKRCIGCSHGCSCKNACGKQ